VTERESLVPLLSALRDLAAWFAAEDVKGAVIGGVAVSLLARPRFTRDVDAVVWLGEERWAGFLGAGRRHGFVARHDDVLGFARDTRVLLVRHEPSSIDVDVSFGSLPFEEESIDTAMDVDVGGVRFRVPSPENLIVMKAVASRPRDLADIEALVDAYPELNARKVRSYVRAFASILEMPEILERIDAILKRRPSRARSKKK
jgi:hypothetical protein